MKGIELIAGHHTVWPRDGRDVRDTGMEMETEMDVDLHVPNVPVGGNEGKLPTPPKVRGCCSARYSSSPTPTE